MVLIEWSFSLEGCCRTAKACCRNHKASTKNLKKQFVWLLNQIIAGESWTWNLFESWWVLSSSHDGKIAQWRCLKKLFKENSCCSSKGLRNAQVIKHFLWKRTLASFSPFRGDCDGFLAAAERENRHHLLKQSWEGLIPLCFVFNSILSLKHL